MSKLRSFKMIALVLVLILALVGCAKPAPAPASGEQPKPVQQLNFTMGTASVGGMNYPIGIAMTKIWSREIPGMKAVAIATNGSPHNIDLLRTKDIDVAQCRAIEAMKAMEGLEPYPEKMPWIRAITGGLFTDAIQVFALKDKGINSIEDFKGKKIAVGPVGSGGEVDAREILKAYGLTYDDIKPQFIEASQAIEMMEDGLVDAGILGLSQGNAAAAELMLTGKVVMLPISDEAVKKFQEFSPYMVRRSVPANVYPNQDYEVPSVGSPADHVIVREEMPDDIVYAMTKALYENITEMQEVSAVMKQFSKDLVFPESEILVKYHPGAKKYFLEQGWIKE